MEVNVQMAVLEDGESGRMPSFPLLGFYPGAIQKKVKKGDYWTEAIDDKSVLPVAHLMERAYRLNRLVIFKKPDELTQRMLNAFRQRIRMHASISVAINTGASSSGRLWQGHYRFGFFIEQMRPNQSDADGNRWEQMQLKIIDQTEKIEMPE
ncbi:MAG: hypothetical protein M3384_19675 [Acidobacteriota bacterium]|nr:hypothetical protein [Acidobacteriota bacterium]